MCYCQKREQTSRSQSSTNRNSFFLYLYIFHQHRQNKMRKLNRTFFFYFKFVWLFLWEKKKNPLIEWLFFVFSFQTWWFEKQPPIKNHSLKVETFDCHLFFKRGTLLFLLYWHLSGSIVDDIHTHTLLSFSIGFLLPGECMSMMVIPIEISFFYFRFFLFDSCTGQTQFDSVKL